MFKFDIAHCASENDIGDSREVQKYEREVWFVVIDDVLINVLVKCLILS